MPTAALDNQPPVAQYSATKARLNILFWNIRLSPNNSGAIEAALQEMVRELALDMVVVCDFYENGNKKIKFKLGLAFVRPIIDVA